MRKGRIAEATHTPVARKFKQAKAKAEKSI